MLPEVGKLYIVTQPYSANICHNRWFMFESGYVVMVVKTYDFTGHTVRGHKLKDYFRVWVLTENEIVFFSAKASLWEDHFKRVDTWKTSIKH